MMMAWLRAQYFNGARIELSGMMFFLQVRAGNFCRQNASVVKHLFLDVVLMCLQWSRPVTSGTN